MTENNYKEMVAFRIHNKVKRFMKEEAMHNNTSVYFLLFYYFMKGWDSEHKDGFKYNDIKDKET